MFDALNSGTMQPFYQNVFSFPTVFFTFFLLLSMFFWLLAVVGFMGLDSLDVDLPDADAEVGDIGLLAGVLIKYGLNGVPTTIIVSLISLIGWLICYYGDHFLLRPIETSWLQFILGIPVLLVSLYVATLLTAQIIKPLRKVFITNVTNNKTIIGQVLVVRTSRVDETFGEATFNDGGAGLTLKIRATAGNEFKTGDRVVAYEYLKDQNVYRVISEDEFLGNA